MAALPTTRMNLADLAKYMDPKGKVMPVAELLAQKNDILWDIPWQPGNLPTGHQFSVRTALPTAYLRDYNEGTLPSKSANAQETEGMSIIEAWSEIDEAEADLNGNRNAFRAQEDAAFTQALHQKLAQLLIYGNAATDQKEFNGLATRLNSTSLENFVDCEDASPTGGTIYTSVYLTAWGDELFGIYPLGSMAGLKNVDHGRQIIQFTDGKRMAALVSQFIWNCGIVARDYRRIVRIGNINVTDLLARGDTQALTAATNLIYKMLDAIYKLPDDTGTRVFYMNRTVHAALSKMALDKSQNVVTIERGFTTWGTPHSWLSFLGIPIRCIDRILTTEALVVA